MTSGNSVSRAERSTESPGTGETLRPIAGATEPPNDPLSGPPLGGAPLGLRQRAEQAQAAQQLQSSMAPMIQAAASGAASAAAVAAAAEIERRIAPVLEDLEAMRRELASERARLAELLRETRTALDGGTAAARGVVAEQAKTTSALRQLGGEASTRLGGLLAGYQEVARTLWPTRWGWNGTAVVSGFLGGLLALAVLLTAQLARGWWTARAAGQANLPAGVVTDTTTAIATDSALRGSGARNDSSGSRRGSRRGSGARSTTPRRSGGSGSASP
jgi:hypothetical protein